jgi:hypothetical protein
MSRTLNATGADRFRLKLLFGFVKLILAATSALTMQGQSPATYIAKLTFSLLRACWAFPGQRRYWTSVVETVSCAAF